MSIRQLRLLGGWVGPLTAACLVSGGSWAQTCTVAPTTITHSADYVPNVAQTIILDPAAHPLALCNDGTPGAYLIRPGFGVAASRWVIWMHGGGFCINQVSCALRENSDQTVQSLSAVTPTYSTYSTDDFYHVMMENSYFYTVPAIFTAPSGKDFTTYIDQQIGAWYRDPCPSTQDIQPLAQ